ncbi:MAG: amino acid permease [Candidatus Desulforudis sp.]|nr:amino acid permease [Desulforudis sp.]
MSENWSVWRTKPLRSLFAETERSGLTKNLGALDLVALGIGAIIGTGVFVLTGVAASQYAGPGLVLSFVLAGIAAGLAALAYAELASTIPVAGSAYTYTYAVLGEFVAWLVGWNLMLEYMVAAGAVAIGWGAYIVELLRSVGILLPLALVNSPLAGGIINLPAMAIAALITLLVVRGLQQTRTINKMVVLIKLAVIILFLVMGVRFIDPANWSPFLPFGPLGVVQGAAIIFFAYIGFDAVATAAEESRKPQRDLPIGIIGSLVIATGLYILVTIVLTGLVPYTQLNTASPVATALLRAGIPLGGSIVAVGALAGITSVLLVMLYAQSRIFFAMSRDGLLPGIFARVHPRFRTPYVSILVVGVVVMFTAGFVPINIVAQLANIGTLSAFVIVSIGVLVLRRTRPDLPRTFKTPGMPWTPLAAIAFSGYLILNLPPLTWVRFAVWMIVGVLVYFLYSYRRSKLSPAGAPPGWRILIAAPTAKPGPRIGDKDKGE